MTFTQTLFLWTLSAIAVPVAIHLLSRKEGKVVRVGSLRHMEESNTSRFKSLRLNELLLLLVRCLMITWIGLYLSGATCTSTNLQQPKRWLVIESGVEGRQDVAPLLDSLRDSGAELHFLANGFPTSKPSDSGAVADYWSLAADLGKKSDHEIIVVAFNRANGFKQSRPALPVNLTWIPVNPPPREFIIASSRATRDSVISRMGYSNAEGTSFTTEEKVVPANKKGLSHNGDSVMIAQRDTISVVVLSDDEHKRDAEVLNAALRAMNSIPGIFVKKVNSQPDWTFWLRSDEPQQPLTTNTILMRPTGHSEWLTKEGKREWHFTRRLKADEALKEHLVIDLCQLILPPPPGKLSAFDVRSLPEVMTWSAEGGPTVTEAGVGRDLSFLLIILFAVTWAGERLLAIRRNL